MATAKTKAQTGRIAQVIGAVVDVEFDGVGSVFKRGDHGRDRVFEVPVLGRQHP